MNTDLGGIISERHLYPGLGLFHISGQIVFPVYGKSGAVTTSGVVWIWKRGDKDVIPEIFNGGELPMENGITDIGNGWKLGALRIPFSQSTDETLQRFDTLCEEINA